jgi:surface polysaccharide O-acyltransferase-like enzyme
MKNKNESLFPFVDNIRLVSMLAVVCYHSFLIIYSTDKNKVTYTLDEQILIFSYTQLMRYGNICFFLVSGLLFGSKMKGIGDQK